MRVRGRIIRMTTATVAAKKFGLDLAGEHEK
jgi:hypothetical protein